MLRELDDEVLDRDWRAFEAASDWDSIPAATLPAWFPAWYVMEHPAVAASLDPGSFLDTPAAAAARLMSDLLDIERRGNTRTLIAARERLRNLNLDLFAVYMKRRAVVHA